MKGKERKRGRKKGEGRETWIDQLIDSKEMQKLLLVIKQFFFSSSTILCNFDILFAIYPKNKSF